MSIRGKQSIPVRADRVRLKWQDVLENQLLELRSEPRELGLNEPRWCKLDDLTQSKEVAVVEPSITVLD